MAEQQDAERIRGLNRMMVERLRAGTPQPLVADTFALRVVRTRGRSSGEWRPVPLAVVHHGGRRHLVAPDARRDWVANLDAHPRCRVEDGADVDEAGVTRLTGRPAAEVVAAYAAAATGPARAAFPFADGAPLDEIEALLDRMAVFALAAAEPAPASRSGRASAGAGPVAVAGGGPGGALLAYLLARAGIAVTLFESRADFRREYRGDSLHPYTMELLDELGLADELLEQPHVRADAFRFHTPYGVVTAASYARLRTRFNFVAVMDQALLIEYLVRRAAEFPGFEVRMSSKVTGLLTDDDGTVRGVRYRDAAGTHELATPLVVGADGRNSTIRRLADLPATSLGATTDLIWFRLPRDADDPPTADVDLYCGPGRYIGVLGGPDHWRIGYAIEKGGYAAAREAGVGPIQDFIREHVPWLADRAGQLSDFTQTSLLSVDISAVSRWHRPGLLLIGDAAHVISPTGGNGILMAVQDAVAAANRLVEPLRRGADLDRALAGVQADREASIREVQAEQVRTERSVQRGRARGRLAAPPRALRWVFALPPVQRRAAHSNAYGPRPPRLDLALVDRAPIPVP